MEKELDPSIIKSTQTSLGKYVKRPPLSEKLLKKPPFRFLHDIITTVLKTTGFFEGLFEENELVSDNVKDRESKILFLNKVITVVGLANGKPLSVKPSKIVAGQEADKTNELLQCLAQVLDKKISSDEAVKKYKEGTKPSQTETNAKEASKPVKKNTETKKLTAQSNEKLTNQKKEQKDVAVAKNEKKDRVSKSKDRESSTPKQISPPKNTTQKSKIISKRTSVENANQQSNINSQTNKKLLKETSKEQRKLSEDNDERNDQPIKKEQVFPEPDASPPQPLHELVQEKLDTSYTIPDNDLNSSFSSQDFQETGKTLDEIQENKHGSPRFSDPLTIEETHRETLVRKEENVNVVPEHKQENIDVSKSQNNIRTVRQSSNEDTEKKNETRVFSATKNETASNVPVRPTSVRPSSSRPGAPRLRDKHSGAAQGTDNLLVGKVNIITEKAPNEEEEDTSIIIVEQPIHNVPTEQQPDQLASNQHGHLVQQILDSQKELSQVSGKTEIEWQFGAQKAREASNQEIEQIRFNIQALSRAANPLGKLLDHIQEDVEVMRQELQQWTRTYEETSKELFKQKAANDESLLPLHTKVKQLDADIREKQDKIDDLKIVIHKNSSRIEKLLASGIVQ